MSPIGFIVPLNKDKSLYVHECNDTHFYDAVHFHEEYQLTHIIEGSGLLTVGDNAYPFRPGDTYLFGKNLPHVFKMEDELQTNGLNSRAHHISIFFNGDTVGSFLSHIPETSLIQELLKRADLGLKLNERQSAGMLSKMKQFKDLNNFNKLLELLYMLEVISKNKEHTVLTITEIKDSSFDEYGIQRMTEIFNFMESNHSKKISLSHIAGRFNMNPSSFCRFFKSRTQKTFSQLLIEIRVIKACELIREGEHNATETCFETGFTNLSNFHRQFKNIIGMTPTQYKDSVATF